MRELPRVFGVRQAPTSSSDSRRIVRIFSDWMREAGRVHDARAAELITGLGCRIREQSGRQLPGEEYVGE